MWWFVSGGIMTPSFFSTIYNSPRKQIVAKVVEIIAVIDLVYAMDAQKFVREFITDLIPRSHLQRH